jgi:uncharacterized YigZ family protein
MSDLYRTIEKPSEGLYKEKGSKFLAMAYPVKTQEEIAQRLSELRKKYHDARHHCYAWRLGPEKKEYRVNDDGEPSGSAGKPIFGQIQSRDLSDVLIVVIRYFGGTLLGVGGLIRAYRAAASDALDQNQVVDRKVYDRMKVDFSYDRMNSVMKLIKDLELDFEDQHFDLDCSLILRVWKRKSENVVQGFSKIEGCKITLIEE